MVCASPSSHCLHVCCCLCPCLMSVFLASVVCLCFQCCLPVCERMLVYDVIHAADTCDFQAAYMKVQCY